MKYQTENFNGSYDFRCRFHDEFTVERHIHEYSEFLYCMEGQGTVTVNGNSMELHGGQLIWLPPNYIHQYSFKAAKVICAVFSNDFIPLYFHTAKGRYASTVPVDVRELAYFLNKFHLLTREDKLLISGFLNLICHKVTKNITFGTQKHTDGVLYQKVISYVSEHYTEDISLKSVSARFGYNEKYLSHSLHDLTGIHFTKLLSLYRIEAAKKLLADKTQSIATIAMKCGFSAVNTFNRTFKQMTGITPSEYRKMGC